MSGVGGCPKTPPPCERMVEAEENLRVYIGVGPVGKEVVVPIKRRKKR